MRRSTGTRRAKGITVGRGSPPGGLDRSVGRFGHGRPTYPSVVSAPASSTRRTSTTRDPRRSTPRPAATVAVTKYQWPGASAVLAGWSRGTVRQIGQSEALTVEFHGVRGSTPCHGEEIGGTAATPRACRSRCPATTRSCSTSAPGVRYFGLGSRPSGRSGHRACSATCTGTTCRPAVLHAAAAARAPSSTSTRRSRIDGRTVADVIGPSLCPPMFPVALGRVPGRRSGSTTSPTSSSRSARSRSCRVGSRTSATLRVPVSCGAGSRRLPQRPSAAWGRGRSTSPGALRAVRRASTC